MLATNRRIPATSRTLRGKTRGAFWRAGATGAMCLLLASSAADASVSRICDVSYLTPQGWTTPMRREVVFQTGRELNKTSTNYFSYSALGKYALISNYAGEIAIIELSVALIPDSDGFSNDNFKRVFSVSSEIEAEQINAGDRGRKWKLVAKEGLPARFIDSRVDGAAKKLNRPVPGASLTCPAERSALCLRTPAEQCPSHCVPGLETRRSLHAAASAPGC
jgi:hypothetical protein